MLAGKHDHAERLLTHRIESLFFAGPALALDSSYITAIEYQLFIDAKLADDEFHQPDHWPSTASDEQETNPIIGIRPSDARAFCKWISGYYPSEKNVRLRLLTYQEGMLNPVKRLGSTENTPANLVGTWVSDNPSRTIDAHVDKASLLNHIRDVALRNDEEMARFMIRPVGHIFHKEFSAASTINRSIHRAIGRASSSALKRATEREPQNRILLGLTSASIPDLDLDRTQMLAHKLVYAYDMERRLRGMVDVNGKPYGKNENPLGHGNYGAYAPLDRAIDLGLDLSIALDRRPKANQNTFLESLKTLAILFLALAGTIEERLVEYRPFAKGPILKVNQNRSFEMDRDDATEVGISLLLLHERIQHNVPAWEGLRIVRERY